jgi:hypothetical protein
MSFIKQVFSGRGKHTESFSLQATSEVNDGADTHSDLTGDPRDSDKLAGRKPSTADALLQRIQELEQTQKRQATQIHHHMERIQTLEWRIQELEGDLAPTARGRCLLVKRVQPQNLTNTQDEDIRPTVPLPLLTKLPPGAPTMPVPVPPRLSSETPTAPLLLLEHSEDQQDQLDKRWSNRKGRNKV